MALSLLRLSTQAQAYHSALNELSQLAANRAGGPAVLSDALRRLSGPLSLARASRLQLVVTDLLWRKDVEQDLRSAPGKTPKDYLNGVRNHPQPLTALPGFWRVRNRVVGSIQSDQSTFDSLFEVMLTYLKVAQKEAGEDRNRASFEQQLEQKRALVRERIRRPLVHTSGSMVDALVMIGTAMLGEGSQRQNEEFESAGAFVEDTINQVAACLAEAAKKRAACNSQCLAGPPGSLCRAACEASYLLDIAGCALG